MFVLIRQQDPFLSSPIWQLQVSENVQLQPMMSLHNAMLTDRDESRREGDNRVCLLCRERKLSQFWKSVLLLLIFNSIFRHQHFSGRKKASLVGPIDWNQLKADAHVFLRALVNFFARARFTFFLRARSFRWKVFWKEPLFQSIKEKEGQCWKRSVGANARLHGSTFSTQARKEGTQSVLKTLADSWNWPKIWPTLWYDRKFGQLDDMIEHTYTPGL